MGIIEPDGNLRQVLRAATAQAHDRLDTTMRSVAGWDRVEDYARFLSLQHAARAPVEAWLDANAPADLNPPHQAPLIARDLKQLGRETPAYGSAFCPPKSSAPSSASARAIALGIAWVLAGSSLGNRAILAEIRRKAAAGGWPEWPEAFLGDASMLAFWKGLRAKLEDGTEMEETGVAIEAACAVFDHFLAHAHGKNVHAGDAPPRPAEGSSPAHHL